MAAAFSAAAQNFTVSTPDGKTYADGDVVNVGYVSSKYGYDWEPGLKVTVNKESSPLGGSLFSVTVTASEAGVVQFCGLSTECTFVGSEPATHSKSYRLNQTFPLSIEIFGRQTLPATPTSATVVITDGVETVNLTINFLNDEAASINEVAGNENEIAFSGRTMHFSVASAVKFSLFNISGRAMVDRTLSGSGSLNFSNMPAGLYIYRLGAKTGKVLLK